MERIMAGPYAIGFIGAGQLATALAQGWKRAGLLDTAKSLAAEPIQEQRIKFTQATGIRTVEDNTEVLQACNVVVLAVKPQVITDAAGVIAPIITNQHLIISVAAGIRLTVLGDQLGERSRIVRVMPNTAALVGSAATAIAPSTHALPEDSRLVQKLFDAVGTTAIVPESLMDAITGLSGRGPGYVYTFIEALTDGGVQAGIPRNIAKVLAAQTVYGAAKMTLETGQHPAVLKDAVTSPGGTTMAGLHALEEGGFRAACINAVLAATARARELG